jgi:molybdate transport system substrate-binding protein
MQSESGREPAIVQRRSAIGLGWSVLAAAVSGMPAAQAATTDLVVHCDRPLALPLHRVAALFRAQGGVRLRIFPTAPNAIAAQLTREIQNDIVVTQPYVLDSIEAAGLLADAPRPGPWRNRLVIAARRGGTRPPIEQATLAAPDPVWGGGPDGPALLQAAGLRPAKLVGTFDTEEALTLLLARDVTYALLHTTELVPEIEPLPLSGLVVALQYGAALTRLARRPNPEALLRFLAGEAATAALRAAGLEPVS